MKATTKFVLLLIVMVVIAFSAQAAGEKFNIVTLSSRPDMISGGDILVQIDLPANVAPEKAVVRLNGQDVSSLLRGGLDGRALVGLISGLRLGDNKLEVFSGSETKPVAVAKLTNHPITGPIFSGPQEHPFVCQTQEFKLPDKTPLGAPIDDNCSVRTVVRYVYSSTDPLPPNPSGRQVTTLGLPPMNLKPLTSMTKLPADVAYTSTTSGAKVPFVVRVETGTINRAIYQFAVLSDPTKESGLGPLNPPKEWNKRLLYSFGGGCPGGWLKQGNSVGMFNGVLNEDIVGKGYAEASSSLNVFANNCNEVLAAETMMMVKERFIKAYGQPDFTFSIGASGGAEQQIPIADAYPGLLDGIIPSMTFPDVLTNLQNTYDTQLLDAYFTKSENPFTEEQKLAVLGTGKLRDALWDIYRIDPSKNCPDGLPEVQRYDSGKNPSGARCDLFDHDVNIYGRDPATGFARRAIDNIGVQYGLAALNAGRITPGQFFDMNEKIGGYDNDGQPTSARNVADRIALRRAYETDRMINGGLGLGKLPIIDVRPYRDMLPPGDVHQKYDSFALRERLQKANGSFANDVLLVSSMASYIKVNDYAVAEMDEWLTTLKKDTSNTPIAQKITNAKPADLVDSCWSEDGQRIKEPQTFSGGKCNQLYPTWKSPRMVAGGPVANDIYKCQLKPVDHKDYQVKFSESEWAELKSIFPAGVCDWSKPGVSQRIPTGTWQSF